MLDFIIRISKNKTIVNLRYKVKVEKYKLDKKKKKRYNKVPKWDVSLYPNKHLKRCPLIIQETGCNNYRNQSRKRTKLITYTIKFYSQNIISPLQFFN